MTHLGTVMPVDPARIAAAPDDPVAPGRGPVVYWMSRDQRAEDNWALDYARALALAHNRPLGVVFCLAPAFAGALPRHYAFMLAGLRETAATLAARRIPFILLEGEPPATLASFAAAWDLAAVVTDFDPLRVKRAWQAAARRALAMPFHVVDAHNIVPCRHVSTKAEIGARTLRPKLQRLLPAFLTEFPATVPETARWSRPPPAPDWDGAARRRGAAAAPGAGPLPGARAARRRLADFLAAGLARYDTDARDPNAAATSGLSPYLHFGQIAAQRVALAVQAAAAPAPARAAFLEQLIVRRELSDNYCYYTKDYDTWSALPAWARRTLDDHRADPRAELYDRAALDAAATRDPLWNAAQRQLARAGYLPGYLRMYWAKKILEWSPAPEQALADALWLNDRYELDGRDPNGVVGVMWSIGGVHDRPWPERPVFGKIRYMNARGCRGKFDVDAYIGSQT